MIVSERSCGISGNAAAYPRRLRDAVPIWRKFLPYCARALAALPDALVDTAGAPCQFGVLTWDDDVIKVTPAPQRGAELLDRARVARLEAPAMACTRFMLIGGVPVLCWIFEPPAPAALARIEAEVAEFLQEPTYTDDSDRRAVLAQMARLMPCTRGSAALADLLVKRL